MVHKWMTSAHIHTDTHTCSLSEVQLTPPLLISILLSAVSLCFSFSSPLLLFDFDTFLLPDDCRSPSTTCLHIDPILLPSISLWLPVPSVLSVVPVHLNTTHMQSVTSTETQQLHGAHLGSAAERSAWTCQSLCTCCGFVVHCRWIVQHRAVCH